MSFLGYILMKESNTKKDTKGVIFNMEKSKIIVIFLIGFMFGERVDLISAQMLSMIPVVDGLISMKLLQMGLLYM